MLEWHKKGRVWFMVARWRCGIYDWHCVRIDQTSSHTHHNYHGRKYLDVHKLNQTVVRGEPWQPSEQAQPIECWFPSHVTTMLSIRGLFGVWSGLHRRWHTFHQFLMVPSLDCPTTTTATLHKVSRNISRVQSSWERSGKWPRLSPRQWRKLMNLTLNDLLMDCGIKGS